MGLFDIFRKKKADPPNRTTRVPDTGKRLTKFDQLRDAWVDLETEELERAGERASRFANAEDRELRLEARKIVGLVKFRQKEFSEAVGLLREVASESTDASDWFNLTTAATMAGDIAQGEEAFAKAIKCQEEAGYTQKPPVFFMRFYYACALRDRKQYQRALLQIEPLKEAYQKLHITDDTFVYIRGVPMLPHTMRLAMDIFTGLGDKFDWRSWIRSLSDKVDDDGKQYLAQCLQEMEGRSP